MPTMPTFVPTGPGPAAGLDILAAAAASSNPSPSALLVTPPTLTSPGPYNPAAALSPKTVKKILNLEFVEMAELRADVWVEESPTAEGGQAPRRVSNRPPVTDIKLCLECYARMAALLVTRFPDKAPELWAYQTTIMRAAHNYEGANWVAYDRQFRRDMLARKDLNWSTPNPRLYSEAFTGRAKIIPRCQHCLSEDHSTALCPHNPTPSYMTWMPAPYLPPPQAALPTVVPFPYAPLSAPAQSSRDEVCRSYNDNRCRFSRCRYLHVCKACAGPHPATACPRRAGALMPGAPSRGRQANRPRHNPYPAVN